MKRAYKVLSVVAVVGILAGVVYAIISFTRDNREKTYQEACSALNSYNYDDAHKLFTLILDYKDSKTRDTIAISLKNLQNDRDYEQCIENIVTNNGAVNVNFISEGSGNKSRTIRSKYIAEKSDLEGHTFKQRNLDTFMYIENSLNIEINLRASFEANTYSIDYELGEGYIDDAPTHYTYNKGDVVIPTPYCNGKTFLGRYVNKGSELHETYKINNGSYGEYLLTAAWEAKTYHVTFDANGGICEESEMDIEYDSEVVLPNAVKTNYDFAGWYYNDEKVEGKWKIFDNVTLKAHYTAHQFLINYELDGGEFYVEYPTSYSVESDTITIPYPSKKGALFAGWISDSQDTIIDFSIPSGTSGDFTLTALWANAEFSLNTTKLEKITGFSRVFDENKQFNCSFVIPYNVSQISSDAFNNVSVITGFKLEKDNNNFVIDGDYLLNKDKTELIYFARSSKYSDDNQLIEIPNTVEIIRSNAFSNATYGAYAPFHIKGKISGSNVTHIYDNAFNGTFINEINFPNLKYIGNKAFYITPSLTNWNNSLNNVYFIGDQAFVRVGVTDVILHETLESLGSMVFYGCNTMKSFECKSMIIDDFETVLGECTQIETLKFATLPTSISKVFNGHIPSNLSTIIITNNGGIPDYFLQKVTSITNLVIPESVSRIGAFAFEGNNFSSIKLSSASEIGEGAFKDCKNLEVVDLSNNSVLEKIGNYAFKNTKIKQIIIPDSVIDLGYGIFEGTQIEKIQMNVLSANKIKDLFGDSQIPYGLTLVLRGSGTITSFMFDDCYGLEEIVLDGEINLEQRAFKNLSSLKRCTLPNTITEIPKSAFFGCKSLDYIVLPNIVSLGSYAFYDCYNLKNIRSTSGLNYLPPTLKTIEHHAFSGTSNLENIYMSESIESVGEEVFSDSPVTIYIPSTIDTSSWSSSWNLGHFGKIEII